MGEIFNYVTENLLIPIFLIIAGVVIYFVKTKGDKIIKSIELRNEMSLIDNRMNVRNHLIDIIDKTVKAAVGANMSYAKTLKENNDTKTLTVEQQDDLKHLAFKMVYATFPPSLKNEDGILLDIIGSQEILDSLIESLIEKYVYEYNH